jgi:cysteine desulfuration protein SufE
MNTEAKSLETRLQDMADDFSLIEDWEDRYRHLIDLGRALPELSDDERNDDNRVLGCASKVWIVFDDLLPTVQFRGDSDSVLVKGLIALVHHLLNDLPPQSLIGFELKDLLRLLDLNEGLSVQRTNGLSAMVQRLKTVAASAPISAP